MVTAWATVGHWGEGGGIPWKRPSRVLLISLSSTLYPQPYILCPLPSILIQKTTDFLIFDEEKDN